MKSLNTSQSEFIRMYDIYPSTIELVSEMSRCQRDGILCEFWVWDAPPDSRLKRLLSGEILFIPSRNLYMVSSFPFQNLGEYEVDSLEAARAKYYASKRISSHDFEFKSGDYVIINTVSSPNFKEVYIVKEVLNPLVPYEERELSVMSVASNLAGTFNICDLELLSENDGYYVNNGEVARGIFSSAKNKFNWKAQNGLITRIPNKKDSLKFNFFIDKPVALDHRWARSSEFPGYAGKGSHNRHWKLTLIKRCRGAL